MQVEALKYLKSKAITYESGDNDKTSISKKHFKWNIRRKNGWNTKNEQKLILRI